MATQHIENKLKLLPDLPGCYMMKDINSRIIYVGKAKNLKNRVRSYFKSSHEGKTAKLVSEIRDFETIITSTDKEAFLLEITLIQKHKPYYNIKLKRGTGYPWLLFWPLSQCLCCNRNITVTAKGVSFKTL